MKPLADKIRPNKIDEMVGQKHLLSNGKVLRKIVEQKIDTNLIFYGPPGTGKTTLARIISKKSNKTLKILNCTTSSTSDIKNIIQKLDTLLAPDGIILYLDEIQYFNKKQQQTLLSFMETGQITIIASTAENPYFCIHKALLSRATAFEFYPIEKDEIKKLLKRSLLFFKNINITKEAIERITMSCSQDARKALNILELAVNTSENSTISKDIVDQLTTKSSSRYDKSGDEHYNLLSAFQKSIRGSDPDAAVHYLARLLESGDLDSVCRRLMICVCEDVGLAYPFATSFVKSCTDIALITGMPEARIPLSCATILACISPKSNSCYKAINEAICDINSEILGKIPRHLQNKHFDGEEDQNKKQSYKYPHNFKNHFVRQQYLPYELKDKKYYSFGENKTEQLFKKYFDSLQQCFS